MEVSGTGMTVDVLRHDGTLSLDSEMSVRMSDNWYTQSLKTLLGIRQGLRPSRGPALCSIFLTSAIVILMTGGSFGDGVSREGVVMLEALKRSKEAFEVSGSAGFPDGHCASCFM